METNREGDDVYPRVDSPHTPGSRLYLLLPHSGGGVDHLPLQIGKIHDIIINDADGAHASCCQIEQYGRAQTTGSDNKHPSGGEATLPLLPYTG